MLQQSRGGHLFLAIQQDLPRFGEEAPQYTDLMLSDFPVCHKIIIWQLQLLLSYWLVKPVLKNPVAGTCMNFSTPHCHHRQGQPLFFQVQRLQPQQRYAREISTYAPSDRDSDKQWSSGWHWLSHDAMFPSHQWVCLCFGIGHKANDVQLQKCTPLQCFECILPKSTTGETNNIF